MRVTVNDVGAGDFVRTEGKLYVVDVKRRPDAAGNVELLLLAKDGRSSMTVSPSDEIDLAHKWPKQPRS